MTSSADVTAYATQAMVASLSPQTASAQRHQYQQFLEQLVASQECSTVLQSILSMDVEDSIGMKILALSMLHDWIKKWWNRIGSAEHLGMRSFCANILRQPAVHSQPSNFRSKLAAILAEIGERQFPQEWGNMVQELAEVWISGSQSIQEIVLKTITFIYTDCTDTDFSNQLPTVRRQEILTGLKACDSQLLALLYQFLATHVQALLQTDPSPAAAHSAVLAIQLLSAMAGLENHEKFIDPAHNFFPVLGACMRLPDAFLEVKTEAAKSVQVLLQRKVFTAATAAAYLVQVAECLLVEPGHLPKDLEDRLAYVRVLGASLGAFVAHGIGRIYEYDPAAQGVHTRCLDAIFQNMLQLLHMDGRRLAGETLPDWAKMYKDEGVTKYPNAGPVAQALLELYMHKAPRPPFVTHPGQYPVEEWFESEFESSEDWTDFYSLFLSQLPQAVQAISMHFAVVSGTAVRDALQVVVHSTDKGDFVAASAKMHIVTRLLMGFLDTDSAKAPGSLALPLLNMLIQYSPPPSQPVLVEEKLKSCCLYLHVLSTLPGDVVIQVLGHLFTYLQPAFSEQVQLEAGKCFSLFMGKSAHIVAQSPALNEILQQMSQALPHLATADIQASVQQSLLSLHPHLAPALQATLCELTLAPHVSALQAHLLRLLGHAPDAANAAAIAHIYMQRDVPQALQHLVVLMQNNPDACADRLCDVRTDLRRITSIFAKVEVGSKGSKAALATSSSFASLWREYLDQTVFLLALLHHPLPLITGLDNADLRRLAHLNQLPPHSGLNYEAKECVLQAYRALSLACKHGVAYTHSYLSCFLRSLPDLLPPLLPFYVVSLCKHFLAGFFLHLPTDRQQEGVLFASATVKHLHARVSGSWGIQALDQHDYSLQCLPLDRCGLTSDQAALVREGLVFDMTKAVGEGLCAIYGVQGPLAPLGGGDATPGALSEDDKATRRDFLRERVLHAPAVLSSLLPLLALVFALPSSSLTVHALQLTNVLLDYVGSEAAIAGFVAGEAYKACVLTMLKQDKNVVGGQEWQYIDLMLYIFAVVGLGLHRETLSLDAKAGDTKAGDTKDKEARPRDGKGKVMASWAGPAGGGGSGKKAAFSKKPALPPAVTQLPKQTLLSTQLASTAEVEAYAQQVLALQGKKKQQRAVTKDLVAAMVQRLLGADQLAQLGSLLVPRQPQVQDLARRLDPGRAARERSVVKSDLGAVDLCGLFEDDPDL